MTRIALAVTLAVATALPVFAEGTTAAPASADLALRLAELRSHGSRFEAAIRLIEARAALPDWAEGADAVEPAAAGPVLPAEVAARVAELRRHGDRFEAAIRLIEAEAARPSWGWDDCGHLDAGDAPPAS